MEIEKNKVVTFHYSLTARGLTTQGLTTRGHSSADQAGPQLPARQQAGESSASGSTAPDASAPDNGYSETSRGGDPATYLHGYGGIVRGLEREMRGRRAGDRFTVDVEPLDAFGERDPQIVQRLPLKRLSGNTGRLAPGSVVAVNTQQGRAQGIVVKVGRFNVDVDFNHPMAGRSLTFDVEILDVRDATAEEIAHRHAHGAGAQHQAPPSGVAATTQSLP